MNRTKKYRYDVVIELLSVLVNLCHCIWLLGILECRWNPVKKFQLTILLRRKESWAFVEKRLIVVTHRRRSQWSPQRRNEFQRSNGSPFYVSIAAMAGLEREREREKVQEGDLMVGLGMRKQLVQVERPFQQKLKEEGWHKGRKRKKPWLRKPRKKWSQGRCVKKYSNDGKKRNRWKEEKAAVNIFRETSIHKDWSENQKEREREKRMHRLG